VIVVLWPAAFLIAAAVVMMLLDGSYAAENQETPLRRRFMTKGDRRAG
jgi:hypothetical protein